jgi:hypothetical protein
MTGGRGMNKAPQILSMIVLEEFYKLLDHGKLIVEFSSTPQKWGDKVFMIDRTDLILDKKVEFPIPDSFAWDIFLHELWFHEQSARLIAIGILEVIKVANLGEWKYFVMQGVKPFMEDGKLQFIYGIK